MASSIPDRWTEYKACGSVIQGTRIICFKVPLRRNVQKNFRDSDDVWDVKALLKAIPKLRAVVDLTNTTRYYNPEELKRAGVLYTKMLTPGRIIPPEVDVLKFMKAVDAFLGLDSESLVGVHCTHGLNRTGYMVCRYMRDRLGIPAQEAVTRFEQARGYSIERENYIAALVGGKQVAPDFGQNTVVKPKVNKRVLEYSSPLNHNYDELDDNYNSNQKYQRNHAGRVNINNSEHSGYKQEKSSSRKPRTESREYDYKYDY